MRKKRQFWMYLANAVAWGIALFLLAANATAQLNIDYDHFREIDGLSHRWVLDVYSDENGFVWIATGDGLNRFDGTEFIQFVPAGWDSMPSTGFMIREIWPDDRGYLWLHTLQSPFKFDPRSQEFIPVPKGIVRILTCNRGLRYAWLNYRQMEAIPSQVREFLEEEEITPLLMGNDPFPVNIRYVHSNNDAMLFLYPAKGSSMLYVFAEQIHKESHPRVPDLYRNFHFSTPDNSFAYFHPITGQLSHSFFPDSLEYTGWHRNFTVDNKGRHWFIHDRAGTRVVFDIFTGTMHKAPPIRSIIPTSIEQQSDGVVWLGHEQGLLKFTQPALQFDTYLAEPFTRGEVPPIGFSTRELFDLPDGQFLARSNEGTVIKVDSQTGSIRAATSGPGETVRALAMVLSHSDEYVLWCLAGNTNQIHRIDLQSGEREVFPLQQTLSLQQTLAQDSAGLLWMYSTQQVYTLDPVSGEFRALMETGSGGQIEFFNYLSGANAILLKRGKLFSMIDCASGKVEDHPINHPELLRNTPSAAFLLGDTVWIGGSEGLFRMDLHSGNTQHFDKRHGFLHPRIYSILHEGENLWLGTHDGLVRFHMPTETLINFSTQDGLPHHEFNMKAARVARDGAFLLGGLNGFVRFFPKEFDYLSIPKHRILLSSFEKYNTRTNRMVRYTAPNDFLDTEEKLSIHLKPWEKSFSLHFAINDFAKINNNRYAYYIEGLEKPWLHSSKVSQATYQDVTPGNYTFKAKATDSRGVESENIIQLQLVIGQYWYKRWWSFLIYSLIIGFLIVVLYRFQMNRRLALAESNRLRELDQFKTRFYTNITHEFRTPLTVILGMNDNIPEFHRRKESNKLEQAVTMIRRNSRQLLRLIGQILDLAKIDSGSLVLHYERSDVIPYLRYLLDSFRSFATAKGVTMHFLSDAEEYIMDYDREKLLHIVTNLISNAIKFTDRDGHIYLQVHAQESKKEPALSIKVKDTGIGIPPEALPHIFDRFYSAHGMEAAQAKGSIVQAGSGAGVGLSLVREFVHLMQGQITVESKVGSGTTFHALLPRWAGSEAMQDAGMVHDPTDHPSMFVAESFGMHAEHTTDILFTENAEDAPLLMIVEDNLDLVQYLITCLDQEYRLIIAHDGKEGLEKAILHIPDIVISDVMMPEMDGFELCYAIKHDQRTSHIPVVLLTAREDTTARLTGLRKGADAYLTKPFNPSELHIRLQKLVELRKMLRDKYSHFMPAPTAGAGDQKDPESRFLTNVHTLILDHLDDPDYGIPQLCRSLGLSRSQLYRKLKALTDRSTSHYVRSIRLIQAKELLHTTGLNISEIAYQVGFTDPAYFSRCFSEEFGKPPTAVRG